MENPCDKCPTRITYALMFDVHMFGEDCPYCCDKWERYKSERMAKINTIKLEQRFRIGTNICDASCVISESTHGNTNGYY